MSLLVCGVQPTVGVLAVLVTTVVAGCGGGSAGEEPLSREEFATRANEICRDALREASYPQNPKGDAETADALDAAAVAIGDLDSQLRELRPPAELESDFEAWLRNDELAIDTLEKAADAVREEGSFALLGMTPVLTEIEKESDRLSRKIGATECVGPD